MKIAYLILGHRFPLQIKRLVNRLQTENAYFLIHIDRRAEAVYQEVVRQLGSQVNVYFLPRYSCYWGQPNIVRATVTGMQTALENNVSFDRMVLLSGQDYPIKPVRQIEDFFAHHHQEQFIKYFPIYEPNPWTEMPDPWNGIARIEHWHGMIRSRHFSLPLKRKLPYGLTAYMGNQWWAFSRDCVEYVIDFLYQHPRLLKHFDHVYVPDEVFFQCVVLNSPLRQTVVNDDLRYVDWSSPDRGLPATLYQDVFDQLLVSDHLFARKFDMTQDDKILDRLDREILAPASSSRLSSGR